MATQHPIDSGFRELGWCWLQVASPRHWRWHQLKFKYQEPQSQGGLTLVYLLNSVTKDPSASLFFCSPVLRVLTCLPGLSVLKLPCSRTEQNRERESWLGLRVQRKFLYIFFVITMARTGSCDHILLWGRAKVRAQAPSAWRVGDQVCWPGRKAGTAGEKTTNSICPVYGFNSEPDPLTTPPAVPLI
jgi:hypothetical protein